MATAIASGPGFGALEPDRADREGEWYRVRGRSEAIGSSRPAAPSALARLPEAQPDRHVVASIAEALGETKATWLFSCPGCLCLTALMDTQACSIATCNRCYELSGEITRTCVVCRRTSRGDQGASRANPDSTMTAAAM